MAKGIVGASKSMQPIRRFVSSDGREAGREPDCAQLLVNGLPRVDLVEVVHPDG